jgi:arylsulfatase A-like enzyme
MMARLHFLRSLFVGLLLAFLAQATVAQGAPDRPNIVVLLVDDAAFMDFGVYGGEARTPHIDRLAAEGALFTRYRTSPLCSPSRAMLLTGLDNHLTGVATIPEVLPKEHVGQPGYTMSLEPGVATLAERLKPLGYRSLLTGKWHLGSKPGDLPSDHGFDRSFALDASGADNWEDKSYMPYYRDAPWFEDGQPASLPDKFYSSDFIVDKMIEYLGEASNDVPFFAFLGFQAIHIPVQAPADLTAGYDGVYDAGWQALREARWNRAQALGFIPEGSPLKPMPESFRKWDGLSPKDRNLYAARMQVNAAMLEAMDRAIGRLIAYLRAEGLYDETIFIVTSDNGPEPSRGDDDIRLKFWMRFNGYHLNLDGMGERGSFGFIGPEWAMAAASPFDLFKFLGSEGGLRVPLIMKGPEIPSGARIDTVTMVTDIVPTLLEITGAPQEIDGIRPLSGRSLVPLLHGSAREVYRDDEVLAFEVSGNSAVLMGEWKLTRNQPPHGDNIWRMYNLAEDPGETHDLAAELPDTFATMQAAYAEYATRVGVLEMPKGYDIRTQIERNTLSRRIRSNAALIIGFAIGLAIMFFALGRSWMNARKRASM